VSTWKSITVQSAEFSRWNSGKHGISDLALISALVSARFLRESQYGIPTWYSYNGFGNLVSVTDANNNTTTYEWDNGSVSKLPANGGYYTSGALRGLLHTFTFGNGQTTNSPTNLTQMKTV